MSRQPARCSALLCSSVHLRVPSDLTLVEALSWLGKTRPASVSLLQHTLLSQIQRNEAEGIRRRIRVDAETKILLSKQLFEGRNSLDMISSFTRSLQRRQKQSSFVLIINVIAAAGIAIIMFIQGKLLLISQNSVGRKKEDDAPHYFISPNRKHEPYNISQLPGLWKASQFTGMNSDISLMKIIIVVSHCNKPLHWMQDYIGSFVISRIYIISKCGEQPLGAPEGAIVQTLSNVGRCDQPLHTLLQKFYHKRWSRLLGCKTT